MSNLVKEYGVVEYPGYWIVVVRAGQQQQIYLTPYHQPEVLDELLECLMTTGFVEVGWKEAGTTST